MSITQKVDVQPEYKIFLTEVEEDYLCITALVTDPGVNPFDITGVLYEKITKILSDAKARIVHERIFGKIDVYKEVLEIRNRTVRRLFPDDPGLVNYIEGESCYGNPLAGIQLRAFCPGKDEEGVRVVSEGNIPHGRIWTRNGARFLQFQNIHGGGTANGGNRREQAEEMFRKAEDFLKEEGVSYRDVVRTWIYVENILDWYHEFNLARNKCYTDIGLLKGVDLEHAEKMFLPASTGIVGKNPKGSSIIMDLLAISQRENTGVEVKPIYGVRQRSPYRYGSAFSRAVSVDEPGEKWIFLSGTASINEKDKSVYIGDVASQVRHTFEVVKTLISAEEVTFSDCCEATVFLKRKSDFSLYQETAKSLGLSDIPAVYVIADVCREELLFELDAAFVTKK